MSYPNADPPWEEERWRAEVIRRLRLLAGIAADGGVVLAHENCNGWGGLGPRQSLEMLAEVDSPSLQLLFDTGNPCQYGQDSWEYYEGVRERVAYVHIKDYFRPEKKGDERACHAGEGIGHVREIIADLLARGYSSAISIEPHIASVIHRRQDIQDPELAFKSYIEYGRRLEKLIAEIARGR
jgi:sugar phosphate isomerase/epimerase